MSSGTDKRDRVDAINAYNMRRAGCTNREIARVMGWDVKVVPARVRLGETLATIAMSDSGAA